MFQLTHQRAQNSRLGKPLNVVSVMIVMIYSVAKASSSILLHRRMNVLQTTVSSHHLGIVIILSEINSVTPARRHLSSV
jgi:hypothetical protein